MTTSSSDVTANSISSIILFNKDSNSATTESNFFHLFGGLFLAFFRKIQIVFPPLPLVTESVEPPSS